MVRWMPWTRRIIGCGLLAALVLQCADFGKAESGTTAEPPLEYLSPLPLGGGCMCLHA